MQPVTLSTPEADMAGTCQQAPACVVGSTICSASSAWQ